MKRIVLIAAALVFAPLAGAQLYKYVDKNGKTVYTDTPPPTADGKAVRIAPTTTTDAPKSYVERDKDLQKSREARREQAKKSEDQAKVDQKNRENCQVAKQAYQQYSDGGRILKYNEKGERELMSDDEIEAARAKSKREMDEACKP